ncbi:hypothetical protein Tco_1309335, partial [Tanacetum coccineum]
GITFHGKSFEKDVFEDKSSKELAPSKALLTLDVFDPLHPPLMDFHVTKAFSGFKFSSLKLFSKQFVDPGIKNVLVYLAYLVWGEEEEKRLAREKAQQVEEANIAWDDVQAKIDANYQLAQRLQAQEQDELTNKEKARLFV